MLERLLEEYPQDLQIVYRNFPLISIHDKAATAMHAAEAAGAQGKFWELHDLIFEHQQEWTGFTVEQFQTWLEEKATGLDLDMEKFKEDMNDPAAATRSQAAWDQGVAAGLPGTPFLLFNGQIYNGPLSYGNLDAIVKLILLEKRQFDSCPAMTIDPSKQYLVTLWTEKGEIVIELYPDKAPLASNNFVFLVRQGWYDGVTFHRVIPGFVAQAGDPSASGMGGPGYAFVNEISPDLLFDQPGVVAMANSGPDTNGSQFFITLGDASHLQGDFTIFGRVVSGMDVVRSLTARDPAENMNLPPGDKILRATVEEK